MGAWKQLRTAVIGGLAVCRGCGPSSRCPRPLSQFSHPRRRLPTIRRRNSISSCPTRPSGARRNPSTFQRSKCRASSTRMSNRLITRTRPGRPQRPPARLRVPARAPVPMWRIPANPVVTIRVRVPADMVPGDDIKYVITVQNTSTADAHAVTVRNPLSADVEKVVRAEPAQDKQSTAKQLVWSFGTLKGGASKTIELVLRHKENATELKNLAYVKYEHGEAVTTKIAKPTIKVTKTAPKQTVYDKKTYTRCASRSRTPAACRPRTCAWSRIYRRRPRWTRSPRAQSAGPARRAAVDVGDRETPAARAEGHRVPRRGARVEGRVRITSVSGPRVVADRPAEARTAGCSCPASMSKLTGPTGVVNAERERAVRNRGAEHRLVAEYERQDYRDTPARLQADDEDRRRSGFPAIPSCGSSRGWIPGEAQSFCRFAIKANTPRPVGAWWWQAPRAMPAGRKRAKNSPRCSRAPPAACRLGDEPQPADAPSRSAGRTFTVKVMNHGGEVARNVRVEIDVPDAMSVVQVTPKTRIANNAVVFGAESIAGYGEVTYTLTFEGEESGPSVVLGPHGRGLPGRQANGNAEDGPRHRRPEVSSFHGGAGVAC